MSKKVIKIENIFKKIEQLFTQAVNNRFVVYKTLFFVNHSDGPGCFAFATATARNDNHIKTRQSKFLLALRLVTIEKHLQ